MGAAECRPDLVLSVVVSLVDCRNDSYPCFLSGANIRLSACRSGMPSRGVMLSTPLGILSDLGVARVARAKPVDGGAALCGTHLLYTKGFLQRVSAFLDASRCCTPRGNDGWLCFVLAFQCLLRFTLDLWWELARGNHNGVHT